MQKNSYPTFEDKYNTQLWPRIQRWARNAVKDSLFNATGKPGKLIRLIEEGAIQPFAPCENKRSIWHSSAARWDLWNRSIDFETQALDYRVMSPGEHWHTKTHLSIDALDSLIAREHATKHTFDIKEIKGLAASKSSDYPFDSISQFAVERCQKYIGDGLAPRLDRNMEWGEIHLDRMSFCHFSWAKQHTPFWMNSGGSHHFAAAHYVASRQGLNFKLEGRLTKYSVSTLSALSLNSQWAMFLLDDVSIFTTFMDAMSDFRCDFGVSEVPRQLFSNETFYPDDSSSSRCVKVVFLKRDDKKARATAQVLTDAGFASFNPYIEKLAEG